MLAKWQTGRSTSLITTRRAASFEACGRFCALAHVPQLSRAVIIMIGPAVVVVEAGFSKDGIELLLPEGHECIDVFGSEIVKRVKCWTGQSDCRWSFQRNR